MQKIKNQNGAISLFVMLSMLFFLMFMLGAYTIVLKRNQVQIQTTTQLKSLYSSTATDQTSKYAGRFAESTEVIPISNAVEFSLIGTGNSFEQNGKIYTCGTDKKYQLTNDIIIDIDNDIAEKSFNFTEYLLYGGKIDSKTISIDTAEHQIMYYKNGHYWKCLAYQNTKKGSTDGFFTEIESSSKSGAFSCLTEIKTKAENYTKYKADGTAGGNNFEFLLMYSNETADNNKFVKDRYVEWIQNASVNPMLTTETGSSLVTSGTTPDKQNLGDKTFGGLALASTNSSQTDWTFLNGDMSNNWFYAVCTKKAWNNGIPAGDNTPVSQSLLFVRIK